MDKMQLGEEGFPQLAIPGYSQHITSGKSRQESEAAMQYSQWKVDREKWMHASSLCSSTGQGLKLGKGPTNFQDESSYIN